MNCSEYDLAVQEVEDLVVHTDVGFGGVCLALALASTALLLDGKNLLRPLGGVLGAVSGAVGAFILLGSMGTDIPCEVELGLIAFSAMLVMMLALCVLKTGVFLIGAAGAGALGHLVYEALPIPAEAAAPFRLFDRSGWYFIAVGGAGILGAVLAIVQKKSFVITMSATLGACGIAALVYVAFERASGSEPPSLLLLATVFVLTPLGAVFQKNFRKWREVRRKSRRERDVTSSERRARRRPSSPESSPRLRV